MMLSLTSGARSPRESAGTPIAPAAGTQSLFRTLAAASSGAEFASCEGYTVMRDGARLGTLVELGTLSRGNGPRDLLVRAPGRLFPSRMRIATRDVVGIDRRQRRVTLRPTA